MKELLTSELMYSFVVTLWGILGLLCYIVVIGFGKAFLNDAKETFEEIKNFIEENKEILETFKVLRAEQDSNPNFMDQVSVIFDDSNDPNAEEEITTSTLIEEVLDILDDSDSGNPTKKPETEVIIPQHNMITLQEPEVIVPQQNAIAVQIQEKPAVSGKTVYQKMTVKQLRKEMKKKHPKVKVYNFHGRSKHMKKQEMVDYLASH